MTGWLEAGFLLSAGSLAGLVGTAGGVTSLVSYPALLLAGVPPLAADVTNVVALVACWPAAAASSGPELAGRGRWLRRWTPLALLGGGLGAILLLVTPAGWFGHVVPFLVVAASLALLAQPRLRLGAPGSSRHRRLLPIGLFAIAVYNGYFGAGAGVLTLTLLLVTVEGRLPPANALKNMLVGAATLVSAAIYVGWAPVDWAAAVPLALGLAAGATAGPVLARRCPPGPLRWAAGLCGLGLAAQLLR